MKKLSGDSAIVIVCLAAVLFHTLYESVLNSLLLNSFQLSFDFGSWATPNEMMASSFRIVITVVIAMFCVREVRNMYSLTQFASSTAVFGVAQWWSEYITHFWVGNDVNSSIYTLWGRWSRFGREEFIALAVASVFMIGMTYFAFRRGREAGLIRSTHRGRTIYQYNNTFLFQ
ncbi:MAG: hypothetical protein WAW92_02155 [Minisyncoccia bacterium]